MEKTKKVALRRMMVNFDFSVEELRVIVWIKKKNTSRFR
jgi:hypothetical protein